jgi:DNA-binding GntR family transcriptional regulator
MLYFIKYDEHDNRLRPRFAAQTKHRAARRCFRAVAGNLYNVQLRAVSEHLKIINAFLAEDAEQARKRMTEHLESAAQGVAKVMFQQRGK